MTGIDEYERRIAFALARIDRGVTGLNARLAAGVPIPADPTPVDPVAEGPVTGGPVAAEPVAAEPVAAQAPAVAPSGPDNPVWAEFTARDRAEIARLRTALDAELAEKAQLSERVHNLREKQETTLAAMERRLAQAMHAAEVAQAENARLKQANATLIEANRGVLEAAGAEQLNAALAAELEALRAARALEVAELDEILAGLEPLLEAHGKPGVGADA